MSKRVELVLRYGDFESSVVLPEPFANLEAMYRDLTANGSPPPEAELVSVLASEIVFQILGVEGWAQLLAANNPIADEGSPLIRQLVAELVTYVTRSAIVPE